MEEMVINIPLDYEPGIYKLDELEQKQENSIEMCLNTIYGVLDYETPSFGNDVRMYSIDKDTFINTLEASYDENRMLKKITYSKDGKNILVYINLSGDKVTAEEISNYITVNANEITNQLLGKRGKVYRLFFDYFYDGEAVDYSAKLGLESDIQAILDRYDGDRDALDNSGDYPLDNCIRADIDYLGVLLMCMNPKESDKAFNNICSKMTELIENNILDKLDKADGFESFACNYD